MATYADEAALADYLQDSEGIDPPTGDAAERLLVRAEGDVDRLLGPLPRDPTSGRKLDPALLSTAQQAALSRAVCAACEWRLAMGEEELIGDEGGVQSAGGIVFTAIPRPPGPKVAEELADYGLVARSGTVKPTPPDAAADAT